MPVSTRWPPRGCGAPFHTCRAEARDPHRPPSDKGVIDGEFVVADEDDRRPPVDLPLDTDDTGPSRPGRGSGWTRH